MLKKTVFLFFSLILIFGIFSVTQARGFGDGVRGTRLPREAHPPHQAHSLHELDRPPHAPHAHTPHTTSPHRSPRQVDNIVDRVCGHLTRRFLNLPFCEATPLSFCGDGTINQPTEECDGEDGVGLGQRCTEQCLLEDLPGPPIAEDQIFELTLTNLTDGIAGESGQVFSPALFISHTNAVSFLELGTPASSELRTLAEDGNNDPLATLAGNSGDVKDVAADHEALGPGESLVATLTGGPDGWLLSLTTMLVQTNDGLAAANSLPLFDEAGQPRTFSMNLFSYDAGTEVNNELASHVPGPPFGGSAQAAEDGVLHAHPGLTGGADVGLEFSWTEPVARLEVAPFEPVTPAIVQQGYATLEGSQEVPPLVNDGWGTAALQLDEDNNLHFHITVTGLSGPITAAHFHGPAAAGAEAGVVFDISSSFVGEHAEGVWPALTADELSDLLAGELYLNVHTSLNPGGEIRGQVHMDGNGVAFLEGAQEVPSVAGDAVGTGVFKFINDGADLWFDITVTDLSGPITAAHFHGPAAAGANAGVEFDISSSFSGEFANDLWIDLTQDQIDHLVDELIYVNVHTADQPGGEIRGQVLGLIAPGTAQVMLNEFLYDLSDQQGSEPENEWIELYNAGTGAANLNGWSIMDANGSTDTIPSGLTIEPGEFVLLTDENATFDTIWALPEGTEFVAFGSPLGNGLGNSGDALFLMNASDEEVDAISYGNNVDVFDPAVTGVTLPGYSLSRSFNGNDTNSQSDWTELVEPTPGL